MSGSAYEVTPHVINYNASSPTCAGGPRAGHAMHSFPLVERAVPSRRYQTFVAEVASQFNEDLLLEHILKQVKESVRIASSATTRDA